MSKTEDHVGQPEFIRVQVKRERLEQERRGYRVRMFAAAALVVAVVLLLTLLIFYFYE